MLLAGVAVPLWVVLAITALLLLVYRYGTRTFNHFDRSNLPGPRPWPVIGTMAELYGDNVMHSDIKLYNKYGKFVRMFEGLKPVLMVYDPEWLKEALVKNFSTFTNRRLLVVGGLIDEGLFTIEGDHWKHCRKVMSSEFSSGKIKKMMPEIKQCINRFISSLQKVESQPVEIRVKCNALTLDLISYTAFGLESDAQTNEDSLFTKNALLFVKSAESEQCLIEKIRTVLALFFLVVAPPWLVNFIAQYFNIGLFDSRGMDYFEQLSNTIIENRENGSTGNDFVQMLVNHMVEAPPGHPDTLIDTFGSPWTKKGLTRREIIANAILFLFAGFQTTADTLFFVFYELAQYPHIQEKLYGEITETCDSDDVTPEQVNQLKLLDYCINETMRLYPQGFRFDREASQDITIRGIFVPKGTAITISPWTIQRDPEIWENPEEFDPYRFSPDRFTEKHATAFMPFGLGGRKCIGSRLAMIEMKLAVILTLKEFVIKTCADTPRRPITFAASPAISPEKKIRLAFVKR